MSSECQYHVNILFIVWGKTYIEGFLKFSLPSLLAPGNIPALAETYQTSVTFLVRKQDVDIFESNPVYQTLQSICDVRFLFIDDLIVFGHYATTITLAYERAIKQAGQAMLKTYFILLTSDLIMANDSMKGVIRYIQKGYSVLYCGSIQIIKEEMEPYLLGKRRKNECVFSIESRDLLRESLQHVHPVVFANTCTQKVVHNYRAHRFYMRHDEQVLAGRYFLLHPLCIKPETTDFEISASFDYSFVPTMCPSNNTALLDDSDDFLIIEFQEEEHELDFISKGQYKTKQLAYALSEWTTRFQRENPKQSLYFHARDLTEQDKQIVEEKLNQFINKLLRDLRPYEPQPVYDHPYWSNTINVFQKQRDILKNSKEYEYLDLSALSEMNLPKRMYYQCFGIPPNVYPWHYRWQEYHSIIKTLCPLIKREGIDDTAIFYGGYQLEFIWFRRWFSEKLGVSRHYHIKNLLANEASFNELENIKFKNLIFLIKLDDLKSVGKTLARIKNLIKPNGMCYLLTFNEKTNYTSLIHHFWGQFTRRLNIFTKTGYQIVDIKPIHNNQTMLGVMTISKIDKVFAYSRKLRFLCYTFFGALGSFYCLLRNTLFRFLNKEEGHCTNVLIAFTPKVELDNHYDTH